MPPCTAPRSANANILAFVEEPRGTDKAWLCISSILAHIFQAYSASCFNRVNFGQRGGRMLGTVKIMAFEDEPLNGLFLQEVLEEEGFEVVHLSNAQAAESAIREGLESVAALVSYIRLGEGLSGWELARLAREESPNLPIVFISGDSAADHSAQGVPDSVMIQKPFVGAQLVTALANLLNSQPSAGLSN